MRFFTSMSHKIAPISFESKIGFIGMGVMGRYMAEHVYNAGYKNLTVYNRTLSKCEPLKKLGAHVAKSPKEIGQSCDVVFMIVGYPRDVEDLALGKDGLIQHMKPGSIFCDMTTSKPSLAENFSKHAKDRGIYAFDAPVSGGDVGAKNGTLSIMVGTDDKETLSSLEPVLSSMGQKITYCGPAGTGQHTKMVNQILISTMMIGVVEGLLYGHKAGLDLETTIAAVGSGAAGSWSINNYGPRILKRNFDPGFFVEHFVKDLEIALDEARRMDLCLLGLSLAHQFYVALKAKGKGKYGTHALMLVLEELNNTEIKRY